MEETVKNEKTEEKLSYKKRMSLVIYLGILFIIAILLVTFTLVVQIRRNTPDNTASENIQLLQEKTVRLEEELQQTRHAYDALSEAKAAQAAGDTEEMEKALAAVEPIKNTLSETALKEYNALCGK